MNGMGEILVVDDTNASLQLLVNILSGAGYQVRPADSGPLALSAVAVHPPDLILLDVLMDDMDGFEVCRRLKTQEGSRHIPIIFLTALSEISERVAGLQLGAVDFISKPFQPEELLARVHTHLELSRLHTRLEQLVEERTAQLQQTNERLQNELEAHRRTEAALQESQQRLGFALAGTQTGVWEFNPATGDGWWDEETRKHFGIRQHSDRVQFTEAMQWITPADAAQKLPGYYQALEHADSWHDELQVNWPDGSQHWVYVAGQISRDETGQAVRILGLDYDITERKENEEKLRNALTEKEILLKEVHHRVKNNLAAVVAMLALRAESVQDERARQALLDSQQRVQAMAIVHEELYQSGDLAHIDFGHYLERLAGRVIKTYRDAVEVHFILETQKNVWLTIDKAIPLGQLVNELITNVLKHAFPAGRTGTLWVRLSQEAGRICIEVADNGCGLPEGVEQGFGNTLGMQLVQALTRQVAGKLEVCRGQGTAFILWMDAL